jgi:hypothetical protein
MAAVSSVTPSPLAPKHLALWIPKTWSEMPQPVLRTEFLGALLPGLLIHPPSEMQADSQLILLSYSETFLDEKKSKRKN